MSDDPAGEIDRVFRSIVDDPDTQAWTFAALGPDGCVATYGVSSGDEDDYQSICAGLLIQFASASQKEQSEFIRGVIQDYNRRKKNAYGHHTLPSRGDLE